MKAKLPKLIAFMIIGAIGLAGGFALAKSTYPPVEILVSTHKTVNGENITYPDGTPKITAAIVTMQAGQSTGWHRHDAPLFAWIMEGEITVDYGDTGKRTYRKGEAFIEALNSDHNGTNTGDGFARILAVFAGADNASNTVMRD
ncbi:MAG: cupin domain-containing protein [Rhizobiaceae bacterium]